MPISGVYLIAGPLVALGDCTLLVGQVAFASHLGIAY